MQVGAVGEVMGLLDPDGEGPLEDAAHFTLRIAGAEANVLIALSRLGHTARLVSAVGDDPIGRLVLRTLREQRVRVDTVQVLPGASTGIFFKERFADGVRRVYYYRKDSAASALQPETVAASVFDDLEVLVASGLSFGLGRPNGLSAVARAALKRAAAAGVTVVFDANVRPGLWDGPAAAEDFRSMVRDVDVLLAGAEELPVLMPESRTPEHAVEILGRCGVATVVVKHGAAGATVYDRGERWSIPPFPVDRVVDPVGAGDAFAAGIVTGIVRQWSMADSARLGAVLGGRAVTVSGDWEAIPADASPERLLADYYRASHGSTAKEPTAPTSWSRTR